MVGAQRTLKHRVTALVVAGTISASSLSAVERSAAAAAPVTTVWAQAAKGAASPTPVRNSKDLIDRGHALFDDQQYDESIQTLSAVLLRPNNTREQKIEIYKLLAFNYITLNRKDEAESAVRGLLAISPEYDLPASESPRFRDFFQSTKKRWEAEGRPGKEDPSQNSGGAALVHTSPTTAEAKTQIDLAVRVTDPQKRIRSVNLFYRTGGSKSGEGGEGKFVEAKATLDDGVYHAIIPSGVVEPPLVEYYLQGVDGGGLPVVSRGDASAPLRIAIPEAKRSGWVLPVIIGGSVLVGAAAIVGGLALAGVFKSEPSGPGPSGNPRQSTVTVIIGESSHGFRF